MVKDAVDGQVLVEIAEAIGTQTNNVAEYRGLIAGLRLLLDLAGDGAVVEARMDSKLVIEQMAGRWKIKNEGLRPLALEAAALARRLKVTWQWIPREKNKDADRLANEAMDAAAKGRPWRLGALRRRTPRLRWRLEALRLLDRRVLRVAGRGTLRLPERGRFRPPGRGLPAP